MWEAFLDSDYGQWLVNTRRWLRRLYIDVHGIEPRGKAAMPTADKAAFRAAVAEQLVMRRRKAFRGPVVMHLRFETTDKNPGHIHTIAKNILDLLGRGTNLDGVTRSLLYSDDAQVCGLAVSCRHGASAPWISISARSLYEFRQDLAVAMYVKESVLPRDDRDSRSFPGLSSYAQSQTELLRIHRLRIADLAYFYRASDFRSRALRNLHNRLAEQWEGTFLGEPFRILVGEPPQAEGGGFRYKRQVRDAVGAFREQFARMLSPLVIPVALEVVVKPPPATRAAAVHDLDNLLRNYLIPSVVDVLQPPSHFLWGVKRDDELRLNGFGHGVTEQIADLPKSSAVGLVRMEAWRIMRSPGDASPGFVSIAIVGDHLGLDDSISAVDRVVDAYTERLRD